MPSLSSLKLPSLSESVLAFFSEHGIFSVEDFLVHDTYNLVALSGHEENADECKQVVAEILMYLEGNHPVWLDGMELLTLMQHTVSILPTGCKSFDDVLQGGLREGTLTELVGASSSGKTQICIQTAASAALRGSMVAYIDTCNSFSPLRLAEVICGLFDAHVFQTRIDLEEAMKRILCYRVHDVFSLLQLLHRMDRSISLCLEGKEGTTGFQDVKLIVLDSVSSLVAPILGSTHSQGHALMMKCGQTLRKIASENHLCVLVTNHTVAGENRMPKPALGESWKAIPHARMQLMREPGTDICSATLIKHSSMRCNQQGYFRLGAAGMQPP